MADRAEIKRSVTIAGHRTSVALERDFWEALREISSAQGLSQSALIAMIDAERIDGETGLNLSRAIRVNVLNYYRSAARR